ncbi:hypothetical protein NECID01_0699 [Nematocida sp. AWRm77]|nr:hypothetical protein NECID01_0699 [Nematocida sp. AWRm77]
MGAHTDEPSLVDVQKYLAGMPGAFYNHPELLEEIRDFEWSDLVFDEETEENTRKNAKYTTCKVLYEMHRQRKRKVLGAESEHRPAKVKFAPEAQIMTKKETTSEKTLCPAKSILKAASSVKEEKLSKKHTVYIAQLEEENTEVPFVFFPCKEKDIPESLANK